MGTLQEDQSPFLIISHSVLLRMKNVSVKVVERVETRLMFIYFVLKIVPFIRNVEKYCRVGQATDNNMALEDCILDT